MERLAPLAVEQERTFTLTFVRNLLGWTYLCLAGYLFPAVRNIEEDLADHAFAVTAVGEAQPV